VSQSADVAEQQTDHEPSANEGENGWRCLARESTRERADGGRTCRQTGDNAKLHRLV